jgi:hypothetical protein
MPGPQKAHKAQTYQGTPKSHGFSFPAEWHPRRGTWISWPRPEGISFPGKYHEAIEDIAGLIRVLAVREEVHLNVPNENYKRLVAVVVYLIGANTYQKGIADCFTWPIYRYIANSYQRGIRDQSVSDTDTSFRYLCCMILLQVYMLIAPNHSFKRA